MALPSWAPSQLGLQATADDSSDPFESISDFFDSGTWGLITFAFQVFVVLLWVALVWWTYQDARRRIQTPALVAGSVALSVLLPFLGTIIYLVVRPPEYLLEARERELELIALEQRLGAMGDEEGQRIIGRILGREPGSGPDAGLANALRAAGVATREDLNDLDIRLTELEYRLRRGVAPASGVREEPRERRPAQERRPAAQEPAPTRRVQEDEPQAGDTGRTVIRRMRRTVRPDPEASVE
jgi:hypothetical protein